MRNISSKTLITFLIISLTGIIGLQTYLFQNSIKVKEDQFDQNALSAMNVISGRLEKMDAMNMMIEGFEFDPLFSKQVEVPEDSIFDSSEDIYQVTELTKDTVIMFQNGQAQLSISHQISPGIQQDVVDGSSQNEMAGIYNQMNLMDSMFNNMLAYRMRNMMPINQRFSTNNIDSVIRSELEHYNIKTNYEYAVAENGYLTDLRSDHFDASSIDFKVPVFKNDFYTGPKYLLVSFPNKSSYVIKSMWLMFLLSLVFTAAIIATFWNTLLQMQKQKRISQIKTDFINNMTHEFKTPIATINLAIDAMRNPRVSNNQEKLFHYSDVIRQENKRMHAQVEKVLKLAMLDNQEIEINKEKIEVNELVTQAISHVALQVEQREGAIETHLDSNELFIDADHTHIENVLVNILDNANKYSPEKPDILVTTHSDNNFVYIKISDKGKGMTQEVRKQVFERFYREERGNIHNVKGHGLGLSYALEMIKLHNGFVEVESQENEGSMFTIKLPIYESE
jgi:two-component system phosphate regulon sensor histidine kinase PhoR